MTQAEAYVAVVRSIADAIQELGSVPSGHLYARSCMHFMSVNSYQQIIDTLKQAGVIEEKNHVLYWIGTKKEATS